MPAARAIAFAAFAGACGLLGATASAQPVPTTTWPQYQYGSDHNAVFDTPHWSVSWRSAPAGDMIHGGLSIVGATLYFESFDHNVYALDALTGKELWRRPLRYIAMNTPVVGDGLVFAGTGMAVGEPPGGLAAPLSGMAEGDSVYALDAKSGESVWKFDTKGHNMPTGALLSNGRRSQFIFSGGHERIFSLDAHSGELLWQRSALGIDKMASLALYHEQIYGSSGQKTLDQATYFQSGATIYYEFFGRTWTVDGTGKLAWSAPYGEPGSSPTVADERVFVESWQSDVPLWFPVASQYSTSDDVTADFDFLPDGHNEVAALDAKSGRLLWRHVFGGGRPTLGGSHMYAVGGVYADGQFFEASPASHEFADFDARTGKMLWSLQTSKSVKMSAIVHDGLVYFGDVGNTLYVVKEKSGQVLQRVAFPGTFGISPPILVGDTVFVVNGNSVYASRARDLLRGIGPRG